MTSFILSYYKDNLNFGDCPVDSTPLHNFPNKTVDFEKENRCYLLIFRQSTIPKDNNGHDTENNIENNNNINNDNDKKEFKKTHHKRPSNEELELYGHYSILIDVMGESVPEEDKLTGLLLHLEILNQDGHDVVSLSGSRFQSAHYSRRILLNWYELGHAVIPQSWMGSPIPNRMLTSACIDFETFTHGQNPHWSNKYNSHVYAKHLIDLLNLNKPPHIKFNTDDLTSFSCRSCQSCHVTLNHDNNK